MAKTCGCWQRPSNLLILDRFLTDTLMSGYFANRTFFKLHHQLGLLDNPDQVNCRVCNIVKTFSSVWRVY